MPEDKRVSDSILRANQARVDFIRSDLDAALTFAQIARESRDAEKTTRNTRNARLGYDTVVRFLHRTTLSMDEQVYVDEKLDQLRLALVALGESVG